MSPALLKHAALCSCLLCYTSYTNPLEDGETEKNVSLAMAWAKKVYLPRLPEKSISYKDPQTGFAAVIKTLDGDPTTVVVSFRGTATTGGMLSNLSLNYPQFQTPEFLHTLRTLKKIVKKINPKPKVIITGHSSGGGLAEAFAYDFVKRMAPEERAEIPLKLITWNGIGAKDWYEHNDRNFKVDPEVSRHIEALHFRASKDYISRIGQHIVGETWNWDSSQQEALTAHKVPQSIEELKSKALSQNTPPEALSLLTGPTISRKTFVALSFTAIRSKHLCLVVLRKARIRNK